MAEPKEIGTVWTLGCEVFVEDALTAEVQEIKVNDIVLSANIFTEGLSVEVGSDRVNAMDLDVRISMDGLKTYIIDSQIVPYEDVLKITDFSPEATNEKRYASSANTSKKIIDSVGELEGRVNLTEGDIDALGKRVDDLELKGTGGSGDGFWYLNEQDGKIHTDIGIVVHGDAIVEGDTSSGGEGEDVVVGIQGVRVNGTTHYDDDGDGVVDLGTIESGGGGGLTSVSWGDIKGTPPSVSTFDNDVPYVDEDTFNSFSEDVNTAISEVSGDIEDLSSLLSSMWHLDENGNLVTDKQVLIKNNLIIDGDTSSGGEGEDTPSGGISGVKVNGTTYYDDNGDGVIDLGTISGGGGTADLSNYYTKGEADARYLALSGGTISGDLSLNQYLRINAWAGYGSGSANAWYNGNTQMLLWENVSGIGLGSNVVIHSGNIGSYKAGDSALFDGRTSGEYYLSQKNGIPNGDLANLAAGSYYAASAKGDINPLPIDYCSLSVLGQSYYSQQLCMYHNATRAWLRGIYNTSSGASVTEWHELAFLDSNVASAKSLIASDGTTYVSYNTTYGQVNVKGINIGYGGNTIETASGGVLNIQANSTAGTIISPYGGNVGIGTISPSAKLHVDGQINISGGTYNNYSFIRSENYTSNQSFLRIGVCYGYSVEATAITIRYGVTSVTGDLIVSGDTSSGSDIRFKDIIKNKTLKIEHIAKAPLFTFKWNDREDDTIHLGSSAQYWENIAPWLVSGSEFKSLNYATLGVAMGISLAKKAVNHEERIKVLEKEVKRLKEEMIHG